MFTMRTVTIYGTFVCSQLKVPFGTARAIEVVMLDGMKN